MEWALPAAAVFCVLLTTAVVIAAYALHLSISTRIDVKALQNSTHSVQMVPIDSPDALASEDEALNKILDKADDRLFEDMDDIHQQTEALM